MDFRTPSIGQFHLALVPVPGTRKVRVLVDGLEVARFARYRDIPRKWLEMATECCTEYVGGAPVGLSGFELPTI